MVRSPILEIEPSFYLPPVERWSGASPSQAEKSRPFEQISIEGVSAIVAVAAIGHMPGIVISRRAASSSRARRAICLSSSAT